MALRGGSFAGGEIGGTMPVRGWEFWRLDTVDGGELAWLGVTRPGARSTIDRTKVWTLVPALRMFIANWFVTEDHACESGLWVHDNIHIVEACDLVGEVPEVSKEDLDRIVRPERCLPLDQIDRHPVVKVMGKRADEALKRRV